MPDSADLERLTDEQLIERARSRSSLEAHACLDVLYRRYYPKVAYWCLQTCGNRQEAADVAQEVFLRVHDRLDTFRSEGRFSSWLYAVTRSVAINRSIASSRRQIESLDQAGSAEPVDPAPTAEKRAETTEIVVRLKRAMRDDLDPLEAKILYLHHVNGLTLPTITDQLGLQNKSGAKAYLVSAKRKLGRKFGRWLAPQSADRREQ